MQEMDMCYKCPKRRMVEVNGHAATCHAVCPEYKEARAKRDAELQENLQQSELVRSYFIEKVKDRMT